MGGKKIKKSVNRSRTLEKKKGLKGEEKIVKEKAANHETGNWKRDTKSTVGSVGAQTEGSCSITASNIKECAVNIV